MWPQIQTVHCHTTVQSARMVIGASNAPSPVSASMASRAATTPATASVNRVGEAVGVTNVCHLICTIFCYMPQETI